MDSSHKDRTVAAADPFAADIFAARTERAETVEETPPPPVWSAKLPSPPAPPVDWDELLENVAADFSEDLTGETANALTRLLDLPPDSPIEIAAAAPPRQINAAADFTGDEPGAFWLTIAVESSDAEIYIEIGDAFAAALVDAALDRRGASPQVRELTASEAAVVEFLAMNLAHEINLVARSPIFKFRSLDRRMPALLRAEIDATRPALLVFRWQIVHKRLPAVVDFYFAPGALRALQPDENRLLANRAARRRGGSLQDKIENVRARLYCGATELSLGELAAIEAGDIVLLQNHAFRVGGANLYGEAEFFLGDAENARVGGRFIETDFAFGASTAENAADDADDFLIRGFNSKHNWQFLIERLTEIENPVAAEKSMTETTAENFADETHDEAAAADAPNHPAIENLAVTLRVELEARRLTLAEVANLRENQTLELGIRPTDAVNLFVGSQLIGRGELVAVEDRLGVRITKLLR